MNTKEKVVAKLKGEKLLKCAFCGGKIGPAGKGLFQQ